MTNGHLVKQYAAAAYPAVAVETCEDDRVLAVVCAELRALGEAIGEEYTIATISATGELRQAVPAAQMVLQDRATFPAAFAWAGGQRSRTALIAYDAQHLLSNPGIYRALKNQFASLKASGSIIILVAPAWSLPAELRHDVPVLRMPLPTREELGYSLERVRASLADARSQDVAVAVDVPRCLDAATGLTAAEAESAYALAIGRDGIRSEAVVAEKVRLIRSSGLATIKPALPRTRLGGLGGYQSYLDEQIIPWLADPELRCSGVLMVGVQGCGKTLSAQVTGSTLGWPVIRLDVGSLKGSLVGQSEGNLRAATALCDAVAPAVVLLDEIEKGVGGARSSAETDGGTTSGMLAHLLQWLEEQAGCVVIATCNRYELLPAEFTRAGRFSERFFVDLPTAAERLEIAWIHLDRLKLDVSHAGKLADISDGWSGAELEECVISAARKGARKITPAVLREAASEIRPLSRVRAEEVKALREWGAANLRRANSPWTAPSSARKVV